MKLKGSGTEDDPYLIESTEDYAEAAYQDGYFEQVADIDIAKIRQQSNSNRYIIMGAVLALGMAAAGIYYFSSLLPQAGIVTLAGIIFIYVYFTRNEMHSSFSLEFSGGYNGNGYAIRNPKSDLFGTITDGSKVHNVHVTDADVPSGGVIAKKNHGQIEAVSVSDSDIFGNDNAGALVGRNKDGNIHSATINNVEVRGGEMAGSVVGVNDGQINTVTVSDSEIKRCDVGGGVAGTNQDGSIHSATVEDVKISGSETVGGTAGTNHGQIDTVAVLDCSIIGGNNGSGLIGLNEGGHILSALVENIVVEANATVGGAIGISEDGLVEGIVVNQSELSIESGEDGTIGGFIGQNESRSFIRNCSAVRSSVDSSEDAVSGGFVGVNGESPAAKRPMRGDNPIGGEAYEGDGVIVTSFSAVTGANYKFAGECNHVVLSCYVEKNDSEDLPLYDTHHWPMKLPIKEVTKLTGDHGIKELEGNFWTDGSNAYPEPPGVLSVRKSLDGVDDPYDEVQFSDPLEERREDLNKRHQEVLQWVQTEMGDNAGQHSGFNLQTTDQTTDSSGSTTGKTNTRQQPHSSDKEPIPIESVGGFLSVEQTLGYIDGEKVRGAGGLLTKGRVVAELDGNKVRDPSGIFFKGEIIAEVDGTEVRDIAGILESADTLAAIEGNEIVDKGGYFDTDEVLAKIGSRATTRQKGAAAAAIALSKLAEE